MGAIEQIIIKRQKPLNATITKTQPQKRALQGYFCSQAQPAK
jgi:hypothetical protein